MIKPEDHVQVQRLCRDVHRVLTAIPVKNAATATPWQCQAPTDSPRAVLLGISANTVLCMDRQDEESAELDFLVKQQLEAPAACSAWQGMGASRCTFVLQECKNAAVLIASDMTQGTLWSDTDLARRQPAVHVQLQRCCVQLGHAPDTIVHEDAECVSLNRCNHQELCKWRCSRILRTHCL
jgi:hypothetical protein